MGMGATQEVEDHLRVSITALDINLSTQAPNVYFVS